MPHARQALHLLRPVTEHSIVRARRGVRYTEIDDAALLYDPITRAVHRLSPAAAAVWLRLDGRELAATAPDRDLGPTIELVRRLRVLGVAEDASADPRADGGAGEPDQEPMTAAPRTIVWWPGRVVSQDEAWLLELDGDAAGPGVELDLTTLVPVGGDEPIRGVRLRSDGEPDDRTTHRSGLDALRAAAEVLPPSWFAPLDALDRLADLVDAVPVIDER